MSIIAAALRHMFAAGMSQDAIIAAVADMESSFPSPDDNRSPAAIRQQRYRDNQILRSVTKRNENVTEHNAVTESVTKRNDLSSPLVPPLVSPTTPSEHPPIIPPSPPKRARREPLAMPEIPDWIPTDAWQAFLDGRKKWPPTAAAVKDILRKLAEFKANGDPPGEVLMQSARSGWRDVFQLKDKFNARSATKPFQQQDYRAGTEGFDAP